MSGREPSRSLFVVAKPKGAGWLGIIAFIAVAGTLIAGCRPSPPPPSDPNAGPAAAEFCVNAIGEAVTSKRIEVSLPEQGRKYVRAIEYTENAVRVVYESDSGENLETVSYSLAIFITSLFGEANSPALKIFGETSEPWLRCTQALQYYEQEKAKDVARELQNWVFGDPRVETGAIAGTHTLLRTLTSCKASSCKTEPMPVQIACEATGKPTCLIRRLDDFWDRDHELTFNGSSWVTAGPDGKALFGECSQRIAQIELTLTPETAEFVNGVWTATKFRGSYGVDVKASQGCPGARADYTLKSPGLT